MITSPFEFRHYQDASAYISERIETKPDIGLILGSGLGALADAIEDAVVIPYADIPHFPVSTAPSHKGQLVIGTLRGQNVIAMQGRVHMYEGYTPYDVTFPVRVMKLLGVETLFLTNAAGGLNTGFANGDYMLIEDHISLVSLGGNDPMRGTNVAEFGPRFTGMTQPYDSVLKKRVRAVAAASNIPLQSGVLAFVGGPCFETPAECRMLRTMGADAVCMSTVPETLTAKHCGMKVVGVSAITNMAVDVIDSDIEISEEEVLSNMQAMLPNFMTLAQNIIEKLGESR